MNAVMAARPLTDAALTEAPALFGEQPQLANPVAVKRVPGLVAAEEWCAQPRHAGERRLVRCSEGVVTAGDRRGRLVALPSAVVAGVRQLDDGALLDGVLVGEQLIACDLLELDGADIREWPYRERLAALMNLILSGPETAVKLIETTFTPETKFALQLRLQRSGVPGIVFRHVQAIYRNGRPRRGGPVLSHTFLKQEAR